MREVDFHCPLCGAELQSISQQKKSHKLYQIAHIYPNRPTPEQYATLPKDERLGTNSESYENKIALCKNCHGILDFHTTIEEFRRLLNKKKQFLLETALHDATLSLGLEKEISFVVQNISKITSEELSEIDYSAVPIASKFSSDELLLKTKVTSYVLTYFPYIRDQFKNLEGSSSLNFQVLSSQIRACFLKMNDCNAQKSQIFECMVDWLKKKTLNSSTQACEAVISFFIQECEVFYEIAK